MSFQPGVSGGCSGRTRWSRQVQGPLVSCRSQGRLPGLSQQYVPLAAGRFLTLSSGCVTSVACCQVFLKPGVLSRLEKQRDKLIAQKMILLQAACKGFLSRQKFKRLKVSIPRVVDTLCPPKHERRLLQGLSAAVVSPRASKLQLCERSSRLL